MLLRISCLTFMITLVLLFVTGTTAWAQPAAGEASSSDLKWFDFFVLKGGYITLVLIALSVVTIALTVEHALSIRRMTIVPAEPTEKIKGLIDKKKYVEAVKFTAEEPSMMGYVLNAGLIEAPNGYATMERAIQESLDDRSSRLFRKIEYLNVIGNVSPMIGLFGTVYGMILLFARIHRQNAFPPPQEVANDISVALITTFWGLAVAIPALSVFAIFRNRIDVLTAECAIVTERLLSVFKPGAGASQPVTPRHGKG